ncbi:hypothetical protein AB0D74_41485 [Streptomyces sp. NPDC048278]|uniref:hypothetical protein n=1 Tax=Streptomyces sp. NPDC048278 TaxID=3155809 RepID=UPI00343BCA39
MRYLVATLALAMLACLVASFSTPQRASAAVEDYRPATYNMQGGMSAGQSKWTTDLPQIMNAGYNVIALQEAGPQPPASARLTWTSPYLSGNDHWRGWRVYEYEWDPYPNRINPPWHIYWVRTDFSGPAGVNGGRVNLAILTTFDAAEAFVARPAFWGSNGLPTSRPALGIRLGQTLFFSVHAVSGNGAGNDGPGLLNQISALAGTRIWAAMGDWNREPDDLAIRRGWHRYRTNGATHMSLVAGRTVNRELDYMVSNERIAGYGGVAHGYGSDHMAVMFRRLAASAGVQLLNSHDGNRAMEFRTNVNGTYMVVGNASAAGRYGHWRFQPAGSGFYRVVNVSTGSCWRDSGGSILQWDCNTNSDELFDLNYWNDTGQLQIRAKNRNTCVGDDTQFGYGSMIVTTASCSGGETRLNFKFDYDPGPNAPLVVF